MQRIKFLIFMLVSTGVANGQQLNNSPYTRYGIGELNDKSTSPYAGLAGLNVALASPKYLNIGNPASYSSLIRYNPVFDVAIGAKMSVLKTETDRLFTKSSGLKNFAMGLPIGKRGGAAFGLTPYSTSGYDITSRSQVGSDSVSYNFTGNGSINKVFLGGAFDFVNKGDTTKLSLGVNVSYLFGGLNRYRSVIFQDVSNYNTRIQDRTSLSGIAIETGLMFSQKLNNKWSYSAGFTYDLKSNTNSFYDHYAYTYKYNQGLIEVEKDTLEYYTNASGKVVLPNAWAAGLSLTYKEKLVFGLQYEIANWQNYKETKDGELINGENYVATGMLQSTKYIAGLMYTPSLDFTSKNKSIFQKTTYMFGLKYVATSIAVNDNQLFKYGMSFGMSIPLLSSRSLSTINIGMETGKLGTTENDLIEDNYYRINLGFSFSPSSYDRWFKQRKYD